MSLKESPHLEVEKHVRFLMYHYKLMPQPYTSQASNRIMLMYFVICGLDVLGKLDLLPKKELIDFLYTFQVEPKSDTKKEEARCGFRGARHSEEVDGCSVDFAHVTMTQCALLCLRTLGDDFSRVNRKAVLGALRHLQTEQGSFRSYGVESCEDDVRFTYSAVVTCFLLDDFSTIDVDRCERYIRSCQSYEGGFGQNPGQEAHGGCTFCAVGALQLLGRLENLKGVDRERLIQWLIERQGIGFQGRVNKIEDTCYSHWCGTSLRLLGVYDELVEFERLKSYVFSCQQPTGGIAKWPSNQADILHTYLALCGLSLGNEPGVEQIDGALVVRQM